MTVDDVARRSARRTPKRVALRFADRVWTYRELDDAVSRAAGVLLEEQRAGALLLRGFRVAVQEAHRDRIHAGPAQPPG